MKKITLALAVVSSLAMAKKNKCPEYLPKSVEYELDRLWVKEAHQNGLSCYSSKWDGWIYLSSQTVSVRVFGKCDDNEEQKIIYAMAEPQYEIPAASFTITSPYMNPAGSMWSYVDSASNSYVNMKRYSLQMVLHKDNTELLNMGKVCYNNREIYGISSDEVEIFATSLMRTEVRFYFVSSGLTYSTAGTQKKQQYIAFDYLVYTSDPNVYHNNYEERPQHVEASCRTKNGYYDDYDEGSPVQMLIAKVCEERNPYARR